MSSIYLNASPCVDACLRYKQIKCQYILECTGFDASWRYKQFTFQYILECKSLFWCLLRYTSNHMSIYTWMQVPVLMLLLTGINKSNVNIYLNASPCDLFIPPRSIKTGTCIQVYIDMWFVYTSKKHQHRDLHSSIYWHVICLYLHEASKQGLAFKYISTFDLFISPRSIKTGTCIHVYIDMWFVYTSKKHQNRDLHSSIYWHVICLYLKQASKQVLAFKYMLTCDLFIPPRSIKTGTCIHVYIDMWFVYTSKKHQNRDLHSSIYWNVICLYLQQASKQGLAFKYILECKSLFLMLLGGLYLQQASKQGLAFKYIYLNASPCDLFISPRSIKTGTWRYKQIKCQYILECNVLMLLWGINKSHFNIYLNASPCFDASCRYKQIKCQYILECKSLFWCFQEV